MLTLLFFPGSRSDSLGGTKGVRKVVISGAEILGAPIILGIGLLTAVIFVGMGSTCWFGGDAKAWGCSDWGNIGPLEAETAALQAAMDTMMAVNNITIVSANDNTTGGLGVNNWTALPKGPGASPLGGVYIREPNSLFYYCWDSKGLVYAQNKKDGVTADPDDAEKQRPCKIPPTDST